MIITPLHIRTPLIDSQALRQTLGRPVFLKMEALQPSGSFKLRGIGLLCREYLDQGLTRLVASSAGNAGCAVAYSGRRLGMQVTVVVPRTTPEGMRRQIRLQNASVVEHGEAWDDAHQFALGLAGEQNAGYVHPFDHPTLWKGCASMVDEIASECEKPGGIVLAVGGGGLMCGVLEGLHSIGWADVPVVAVETEGTKSFHSSVQAGELVTLDRIEGAATSLGAKRVSAEALRWTRRHEIIPWVVADRQATDACVRFADDHRVLIEPACGAAVSTVYDRALPLLRMRSLIVIVCGGTGVSLQRLREFQDR